MPKFRWWEWAGLALGGILLSVAAPISDYRVDLAVKCFRSLPLLLVLLWTGSRFVDLARRHQWRPAVICLSAPIVAAMLFLAGQAIADYFEVHSAAHSMSSEVDENYRHVAARTIESDVKGYVSYVVFDPADGEAPAVERTVTDMRNVCVNSLRRIGDHFYLVRAFGKPCP